MGFSRLSGLSSFLLFNRAISNRNTEMFKASEQLSTNKRINRPSDDPEGARSALNMKFALQRLDQYERNVSSGERILQATETALGGAREILIRAKELAVQGNNTVLGTEARGALADQVQQLSQQLLSLANTEVNGEYIFSGFKVDTAPFALDDDHPDADPAATFAGDTNVKSIQVADGSTIQVQVRGDTTFLGGGTSATGDIFQTLAELEEAIRAGDTDESSADGIPQSIENLDTALDQIISATTTVGARSNRLSSVKESLIAQRETLKTFVSDIEDVDLPDLILEMQKAQTALQATISSAGVVMNLPSLMDFLRG